MLKNTSVFCPISVSIAEKYLNTTSRISNLEGKKVGLLWNSKPNGDVLLNRVAELLQQKYRKIDLIRFWETDPRGTNNSREIPAESLDRMASSADVVIASSCD